MTGALSFRSLPRIIQLRPASSEWAHFGFTPPLLWSIKLSQLLAGRLGRIIYQEHNNSPQRHGMMLSGRSPEDE